MEYNLSKMIQELCLERNIKYEELSFGWILQLTKNDKIAHIVRKYFELNSHTSGMIAIDKFATHEVLKSQNIPCIESMIIFNQNKENPYMSKDEIWIKIKEYLNQAGAVVVKPNDGSKGEGVYKAKTIKEAKKHINKLLKNNKDVNISKYYDIKMEYRTFYLNGEALYTYGKERPYVIGDGKRTARELIDQAILKERRDNKKEQKENYENVDIKYIPKKDEKYEISWKHNLAKGALPIILEKDSKKIKKIQELARKAGKALNATFMTVDIIETEKEELFVLEMNAGIDMQNFATKAENGMQIAREILLKALDNMF
jgi:glutathione synthase/RimK-type ligase-like ATP-grasp enzyme